MTETNEKGGHVDVKIEPKKTVAEARAELKARPSSEEQRAAVDALAPKGAWLGARHVPPAPTTWAELQERCDRRALGCGVVLLSGGMDSSACLHLAANSYPPSKRRALLVDYGQPHRDRELAYAQSLCVRLGVAWDRISVADALRPMKSIEQMANAPHATEGVHPATVPGRNAFLLSLAAMHGLNAFPGAGLDLWVGACFDDIATFTDCHPEFFAQSTITLTYGAGRIIQAFAPLNLIRKSELVACATTEPDALETIRRSWSCYGGNDDACGRCTPCIVRAAAFATNSITDDPAPLKMCGGDPQREPGRR